MDIQNSLKNRESFQEKIRILSNNLKNKNYLFVYNLNTGGENEKILFSVSEKYSIVSKKDVLNTFLAHPEASFEIVKEKPEKFVPGVVYILSGLKRSKIYIYNKED